MSSDKIEKTITPKQCKAARSFLGWSQQALADKVRITQKTLTDFERGITNPQRRTIEDIKTILIEAGIKFENDDEGQGAKLLKEFDDNKK
ncbi:MAG: transcriptional regulator with XRE-family HTH domain [Rickettsiales bacterium]|jgi:transcriptional regulator with XRE-family HTH domain